MAGVDNLTPWKPGESGNPGGITSEQRKRILANAEKATRIREAMLDRELAALAAGPIAFGEAREHLRDVLTDKQIEALEAFLSMEATQERLKLVKDSEDRGYGAPKQETELNANVGITQITRRIIREKPS